MIEAPKIKKLLGKDMNLALIEFDNQLESNSIFYNEFLEIKGRFNQLEKEKNRGIIEQSNYIIEINKIRVSTISLIDNIQNQQNNLNFKKPISSLTNNNKSKNAIKILLIILVFSITTVAIYSKSSFGNMSNKEKEVKQIITNYYETLVDKEFKSVGNFYTEPIDRYYQQYNIYFDDILKDLIESKRNVSDEKIQINWKSFDMKYDDNQYNLEYSLKYRRKKNNGNWREYNLNKRLILNQNLKIKSIYEIKE